MPWVWSIVQSIAGAFLKEGFLALQTYLGSLRAEQAQRDLGRVEAERDHAKATNEALEASLQASVDAPKSVPDAIMALREGRE